LLKSTPKFAALACLITATFLWGSSFIALKLAFRSFDPMFVIFARMFIASLIFLIFIKKFIEAPWRRVDIPAVLFMAFCEPCLYFIFEAKAIQNTTASQAGMICAMLPLMVAVAAAALLGERLTIRTAAGFLLAIAGAALLSIGAEVSEHAPNPLLGNFYEFMAMLCATGYVITLKRLSARYSPLVMTGIQAFAGALFFFPFLLLPGSTLPVNPPIDDTLAVLYLGSFVTVGAYGLYNVGVSMVPAAQATAFINLIPVFTLILGWLILGESFAAIQYLASALVLLGVILSQRGAASKTAEPLPAAELH